MGLFIMNCEELIQKINVIRKSKSCLSNAFFTKPQMDTLLAETGTQILESEGLLLIIEEETDLFRVYFYSIDNVALGRIKDLMPDFNKPVIADIVGKNPKAKALAQVLMDKGFEEYCVFVRMICDDTKQLNDVDTSFVEYAKVDDAGTIFSMLYSEFDPLYSHMPKLEEITAAIEKKEIIVVRKQLFSKLSHHEMFVGDIVLSIKITEVRELETCYWHMLLLIMTKEPDICFG